MNTVVVIVGGGFGGLEAALTFKSLTGDAVTITLDKAGAWVDALKKAVERKHLMSYLTRPLLSSISRKVLGIDLFKRLGLKLPF